ncbi:MAG: RNA 2',3'-cyclic phosphodiesterase [Deltaproteobacteria bacterium]|nr:RNA 2',3'-cyclic phosphodiesterase [Deltaproteobacteria bacterium]
MATEEKNDGKNGGKKDGKNDGKLKEKRPAEPRPKRMFAAIPFPGRTIRETIVPLENIPELKDKNFSNIHLTLLFLGNVKPDDAPRLLEKASLARAESFEAVVRGLGSFSRKNGPILWAGIEENPALRALKTEVDEKIGEFVEKPDGKGRFSPHLTLTRLKAAPSKELVRALESEKETRFGTFPVRSFFVYESIIDRRGAEHVPMLEVPLL